MKTRDFSAFRGRSGFTLVELLIVITIIIVLAGLTLMVGRSAMVTAKKRKTQAVMLGIETGLDKYKTDYAEYPEPTSSGAGVSGGTAIASAQCLYQALSGDGTNKIKGITPATPSNGKLEDDEKYLIEVKRDWYEWQTQSYYMRDGFNNPFQYRYDPDKSNRETNQKNPTTYDLWSYADSKDTDAPGALGEAKSASAEAMAKWITNWK